MEGLFELHKNYLMNANIEFGRVMDIDWNDRLIGIKGARGVGKTTYLLKHIKELQLSSNTHLYITVDDLSVSFTSLVALADAFVKRGGTHLYLDEIHKYPNWSQELKNIYDRYRKLHVVFTGSSVMDILTGNADLSRRAVVYNMNGLSFREYLNIEAKTNFEPITLEYLLKNHEALSKQIVAECKPIGWFEKYLQYGYYPYFLESKKTYSRKLLNTLFLTLEIDLPYLRNVDMKYVFTLKKLIYYLSKNAPYQTNVSKLASDFEVSRHTILQYLNYLEEGKVLNLLRSKASSDAHLAKPEKVYLHHPNLMYALNPTKPNEGTLRETFFFNQLAFENDVHFSETGDFLVNQKYTFEIGGKSKTNKQVRKVKNSYVAADEIEYGIDNKIPIWLFGFLY